MVICLVNLPSEIEISFMGWLLSIQLPLQLIYFSAFIEGNLMDMQEDMPISSYFITNILG